MPPRTSARRTKFAVSLVLEAFQTERLLALHLFETKLDEVSRIFHLRDDYILKRVDSTLGRLNLDEEPLQCRFHLGSLDNLLD